MGTKSTKKTEQSTEPVEGEVVEAIASEADSSESAPAQAESILDEQTEDLDTIKKRTAESLADEVEKLRKENAKRRKKEQEAKEEAAKLFAAEREKLDAEKQALEQELTELRSLKTQKAVEEVDTKIEVKQRDAEIQSIISANKELQKQLEEIKNAQKAREEAEAEERSIREQAVQARFKEELKSIPEDKKKFAESIFKGAEGDMQDKLFTFLEAKREGVFGKKQVQVLHKPVNTQEQPEIKQEKLSSKLKIKRGLAEKLKGGLKQGRL
jgi:chromosome segregation ATPase